ncbi:FAD-binding oxidoreductase [Massilia sp. 9I]|uniref:FAD-binding oxidoreductase n=1 Tax=Massilia sp. 9I TaxID=2653152 RepID=UPI001916B64A|nr:FAD-binding oxidoreductase [Massilia sp. 9I]
MHPSRRRFLVQAMAGAGLLTLPPLPALAAPVILVPNLTGLYPVEVARVVAPGTTQEVAQAVRDWPGKIAVGGGRYSMGGQVAIRGGLHLDMRGMNRLLRLDPQARVARVQAGMRWRELQDALDPLGLAVHTMQSYANFTVGGAVSVNAHGRYVGNGPVVNSVRALQLVLADGSVVEATRAHNAELFRAAAGGYGAIGVITEVELDLAQNTRIERSVDAVALDDYAAWFQRLAERGDCVFHNADLLPPLFDAPVAVSWRRTGKALTEPARLVPRGQSYGLEQNAVFAMTELPRGDLLRSKLIHPLLLARPAVKWRNHEASRDVAELEPRTRRMSTYVLQEYFVPVRHFTAYARAMAAVIRKHDAQVLNVSVRHSPADHTALLPWAKEEVFSCVVYYKQRTHLDARRKTGDWTREMIETALAFGGRYYLPYQLHATRSQFERAYPEVGSLRQLKRSVDPQQRFSNELWASYL